ncbi:MAG: ABC transporter ATP-binding protein [Alphaproteobacteria bacterium]|nr:ABC transporter ATP-binding protein [Alphaproteobacteria bacterium]
MRDDCVAQNNSPPGQGPAALGLRIANARLVYDDTPLFDNLSATITGGQWTCILGPSGVGKSTLLRMIAGLGPTDPATDITASDGSPLAQRTAWMAQQDLLLPWLSVAQNVALGQKLRGDPADREQIATLLADVGLDSRPDALPAALSGGQRQRVALARTLMEDRPVVLMDEPFSAVDAITRARLQELAARLLRGRTVLQVTHDPLEALRLGHNIHVMAGRPAKLGVVIQPPGDTPRDPTDPALRDLHLALLAQLSSAADDPSNGGAP